VLPNEPAAFSKNSRVRGPLRCRGREMPLMNTVFALESRRFELILSAAFRAENATR